MTLIHRVIKEVGDMPTTPPRFITKMIEAPISKVLLVYQ